MDNYSVFEIVSTAVDIFIAVIGLIIAIWGFKNERRAKKEEYAKNVTLKEMVSRITVVGISYEHLTAIDSIPVWNEEDIYRSSDLYIEFVKQYNEFYASILNLYKGLLTFESEFSLSYGFDRYILYFREYIRSTKSLHEEIQKQYKFLQEDEKKEDYSACIVDCGHLRELFKVHIPAIKEMDSQIIKELRYKFSIDK